MTNHVRKLTGLIPLLVLIVILAMSYITYTTAFARDLSHEQPRSEAQANSTTQPAQQAAPTRTPVPTQTSTLPPQPTQPATAVPGGGTRAPGDAAVDETVPIVLGTNTPIPDVSTFKNKAVFSFRDVGVSTFTLHFPDVFAIDIDLPDRWQLSPSASYLDVHYTLVEDFGAKVATVSPFGRYRYGIDRPSIEVYVDEQLAGSIPPEVGDHIARVRLPYGVIETLRWDPSNSHVIEFRYIHAGGGEDMYCDYGGTITIKDISTIDLTYTDIPPVLNLATFPSPLVQSSFIPETLYIVLPNDANEKDLTLAARLSTFVGRGAPFANLQVMVVKASEINPAMLTRSSAVFIGTPQRNAYLAGLYKKNAFVSQISADGRQIIGITGNEGLLQLARADVNPNNVYLAVTGNTDEGVTKALNELTFPPVGLGGPFFISRVGYVPSYDPTPAPDTYRIADLGFKERPFYGLGTKRRNFTFFVPRDWEIQDGAKLVLTFAHSSLLSFANSGVTVLVNGTPVGTIPLDAKFIGERQYAFPISKEALIPGALNTFRFEVTLQREMDCTQYESRVTWFNIRDSSLLFLPHKIITDERLLPPMQEPFFYLANEPRLLFVMPPQPNSAEINMMANVSRIIGSALTGPNFDISVTTNPKVDPILYKTHNFIAIGLPTRNTFIQSINDDLPQPFVPGEDSLTLQQKIGAYRVEQSIGIGVAQVLQAPWTKRQGITVMTGTSDEGIQWLYDKFKSNAYIYDFGGGVNFVEAVTIQPFQVSVPLYMNIASIVADITGQRTALEMVQPTAAAPQAGTMEPAPGPEVDKYTPARPLEQPRFGIYLITLIVAVGVVIAVLAITKTIRGGRRR